MVTSTKFTLVLVCKRHCCKFWKWPFWLFTQVKLTWLQNSFYVLIITLTDFNKSWCNSSDTQIITLKKFTTLPSAHQKQTNCVNFIMVIQTYSWWHFICLEFCLVLKILGRGGTFVLVFIILTFYNKLVHLIESFH